VQVICVWKKDIGISDVFVPSLDVSPTKSADNREDDVVIAVVFFISFVFYHLLSFLLSLPSVRFRRSF